MNDLVMFFFVVIMLICVVVFALLAIWLIGNLIIRPILWLWFLVFPPEHAFIDEDLPL